MLSPLWWHQSSLSLLEVQSFVAVRSTIPSYSFVPQNTHFSSLLRRRGSQFRNLDKYVHLQHLGLQRQTFTTMAGKDDHGMTGTTTTTTKRKRGRDSSSTEKKNPTTAIKTNNSQESDGKDSASTLSSKTRRDDDTNTVESTKEQSNTNIAIKIVTFNVAEFSPHNQAPKGFRPYSALEEELDRLTPDIAALQELPDVDVNMKGYLQLGLAESHCGYVGLYIRDEFFESHVQKVTDIELQPTTSTLLDKMMAPEIPAVVVRLQLNHNNNGKDIVVGSCHLEPYKGGSSIRQEQLNLISESTLIHTPVLILGGDMNMRKFEDDTIEHDNGWKDAWKQAGSVAMECCTWNSKINQYHGPDAFQFCCRFDRIYTRNVIGIDHFSLMANTPLGTSPKYYLSDHFGIVSTILI